MCITEYNITPKLKLHSDALVLQAVYDLTAVAPRVITLQLVDDQRRVTWSAPAETHTAPEVAITPVARPQSHHDVQLFGFTRVGLPEPLHPCPAR